MRETGTPMDKSRIAMFQEILKMDPNDPVVYFGLGQEYMQGGVYPEAIVAFANAVRCNPNYSAAYRFLGECFEKSNQPHQAKEVYAKGIPIAEAQGDLEAARAMTVFLKRVSEIK